MLKSKFIRIAAATLGASALMFTASPAATAAVAKDAPTFEEFRAATFRDVGGQYVVNGDEVIANQKTLRDYYDRMIGSTDGTSQPNGLVVNRVGSVDDKWSATQARNLTYCVSTGFGSNYNALVSAMAQGAALWESSSSGVNFTHISSQDSNCRTTNNSVLFSVEPTFTTQYIARAFFPSTGDSQRNVLVNASSLLNSGSWTPGNIMGHELGHTLGFRHEHTRPEAGTCFEDNNWRPLTPYDSASIMHYPQCNGSSSNLSFTATDGSGTRALYGS